MFENAVLLAEKLDLTVVNGFSGCPGDGPRAKNPNWVTCAWPDEFRDILDYQWKKVAIPYWKKQNRFLKEHNVKFAIEAHPGFLVYNPETILKLRDAAGSQIGANFDPSHFWWQGIDPIAAVRALGAAGAVFHVHAKDTRVDPYNASINGTLDTKSYADILGRSWSFRAVGYGHTLTWWKDFVSNLRMIGYDDVLSIEHEDGLDVPPGRLEEGNGDPDGVRYHPAGRRDVLGEGVADERPAAGIGGPGSHRLDYRPGSIRHSPGCRQPLDRLGLRQPQYAADPNLQYQAHQE